MKYTFYAVSNSYPFTQVMEWDEKNEKWCPLWDMCDVMDTKPFRFRAPNGKYYLPVDICYLEDAEELQYSHMPKEFWEYQPCVLIAADFVNEL